MRYPLDGSTVKVSGMLEIGLQMPTAGPGVSIAWRVHYDRARRMITTETSAIVIPRPCEATAAPEVLTNET